MAGERWIFTKSQLEDTPSRKHGIDSDKELSYRQQAANLIQEMGQRLQVTQLCINTAIVYMHRFYMFHSFSRFHRNAMASACLFLAAKAEEQPRKLEHVLKVAHICLHKEGPALDTKSNEYLEQAHELVVNENILLQTLGFDLTVDHPHTNVVKTCQLVRASKDLAQTSYFLATNSLHLTTMCLQLKPTVVACVCVHLACKWSNWEIPRSSEGREWYWYMDEGVTEARLKELTQEFLNILDKCPSKLRKKIMMWKSGKEHREDNYAPSEKKPKLDSPSVPSSSCSKPSGHHHHRHSNHDRKTEQRQPTEPAQRTTTEVAPAPPPVETVHNQSDSNRNNDNSTAISKTVTSVSSPAVVTMATALVTTTSTTTTTTYKEYKERKERERLERIAMEKSGQKTERDERKNSQAVKVKQEAVDEMRSQIKHEQNERHADDNRKIKTEHSDIKPKKHHHHHNKHSETVPVSETKLKIKSEPSHRTDNSSPLKLKIKMPKGESPISKHKPPSPSGEQQRVPPLKISSHHSSKVRSDGSSRHEHRSKSHKHSRHSSEDRSGDRHSNGRSDLKLHINMASLSSRQSSSSEKKDKRRESNSTAAQHSGHPWTVSELMTQKSSSRKRQHSPAADNSNEVPTKQKVSRSEGTLKRTSSNHSIVSMDMSDSGSGSEHVDHEVRGSKTNSPVVADKINLSIQALAQVIEKQKEKIAATPTSLHPPVPFPSQPMPSLFDMDFLSDDIDALPPLPGDPPQRPPTPPPSIPPPPPRY